MSQDFFDYFPAAEQHRRWGVYATSFGQVLVPAGSSYPPSVHPKSHSLDWERGRVLHEYQLLYISAGRGQFESASSPLVQVSAGALFVLFPGIWHRYRPDPFVGWTEFWIELQGTQIEELRRLKIINPKQPVHQVGEVPEIMAAFAAAGGLARAKPPGFQVRLGLLGLQILTHLSWPSAVPGSPSQRIERIVREALNLLASHLDQPLSPEWIARQLHVGYSYFRRAFKAQTGFSPKHYRLEIRFRRTRDLLRHSDLTIKEIAQQLGYDSPYHLSTDFKKRMRISPASWRRGLAKRSRTLP
ncbi:MAG: AraC family transcriptional regulator [Methylacidiphilales bacterium]|nr:AraC family transcriptional regulator [Candidatus Methylacidiphilales bacterium]